MFNSVTPFPNIISLLKIAYSREKAAHSAFLSIIHYQNASSYQSNKMQAWPAVGTHQEWPSELTDLVKEVTEASQDEELYKL